MNILTVLAICGGALILIGLFALLGTASEHRPEIDPDYSADRILHVMNGSLAETEPDENDENVPLSSM